MKILKLKFQNINSLAGENEIDFTDPVFTVDGLFAITGKTGSGKSSILDAISLALYGKTPRVSITGSENAVMTRGEKNCYAEIDFEVAGKKWKSSWRQELNRNGNLKPVNRVIADFNNNIVADQIRTCDTKIEEILGLTFEQFTKVVMLAQGSFAAFLQAAKNEKGEILEQITGTEIYGEISRIVFERDREEKDKLNKISLELEAINILSEEEIKKLKNENDVIENNKKQVDSELQKIETSKKWLLDLTNLQTQIDGAKEKLPELEEKSKKAIETFGKTEAALKLAKDEQLRCEPVFKKVRELDTKISEKDKLLQPILVAVSQLKSSNTILSETLQKQENDLKEDEESLQDKKEWATTHIIYEDLVSNYSAIEKENNLLLESANVIKRTNSDIRELKREVESKKHTFDSAAKAFTEKVNNLTEKTKELEAKRNELANILCGKELSELRNEKEKILNIGTNIRSLIEVQIAILASRKVINNIDEKSSQFENSKKELTDKIEADNKEKERLDNNITLLDENIKLTKTIQSLDEHRHNLKDGEECPLCGSLEHPFAQGNVPVIGDKEKNLAELRKQFSEENNRILQNEKQLVKLESEHKNNLLNKAREEKTLSDNLAKRNHHLSEIKSLDSTLSVPAGEGDVEQLKEILSRKSEAYKEVNAIIGKAETTEKQLVKLRDKEIPALQDEKQVADQQKNKAETAHKLSEQELKNKQDSIAKMQDKYTIENDEYLEKLASYSVENIVSLKKCLDSWNENKKQTEVLTNKIAELKKQIAVNAKELENQTKSYNEKQNEKQNIDTDKQQLSTERTDIFADKSVEEEENRLKSIIAAAEKDRAAAESEKNNTNTELEKNKAIVIEKEKELSETKGQNVTEKTIEILHAEYSELKIKAEELSQKIGANNQSLKSNEENLKTSGKKLKEKEKQQAVYDKWGKLNTLIGSADGKKYRNFAQGLTFEHLIGLANGQLQKMSDRYILKRTDDNEDPFELFVIDKFQNSEQRTAKNLSGGEKFIVSLALALGLANMASKNMRIDTMFIDEGFGTLDSDYLDVALNALSNLQSEGKIIGVISHLTELKERIATHIEVIPGVNGHSTIQITN